MDPLHQPSKWAESLVGRDWEIYWNEDEDKEKNRNCVSIEVTVTPPLNGMDVDTEEKEKMASEDDEGEGEGEDEASEGSIIDDWYAGRVVSFATQDEGKTIFRVLFVGDDEIYEMELSPSKVRPSARGWIKRTMVLLCSPLQEKPWHTTLPPDTAGNDDVEYIRKLREDLARHHHKPISFPVARENILIPSLAELQDILRLRHLLQSQVYLRSKLSKIVNLHGSIKYVDGEPNPTEPLVNHLVQCCLDLDRSCEWYLKCWELLNTCFSQGSGQLPNKNKSSDRSITYDKVMTEYLEHGKDCLVNNASMDVESTTSKRRQALASPSNPHRRKRRRKNIRWGPDHSLDTVADEGDLRLTSFVDQFVSRLKESSRCWYIHTFGNMLQSLSHFIVDPLVHWKRKANLLVGKKGDLLLDDEDTTGEDQKSSDDEADDDSSGESEPKDHFFSIEDVEFCLSALEENPVLSLLDVSNEEATLREKLLRIESLATMASAFLQRVDEDFSDVLGCLDSRDEVLEGLRKILAAMNSPEDHISNINPLGRADSSVTRDLITLAVELRSWFLDVQHASHVKERNTFIESLWEQLEAFPELSEIKDFIGSGTLEKSFSKAKEQVQQMYHRLTGLPKTEEAYFARLNQKEGEVPEFLSREATQSGLDDLGKLPVLLFVEEQYAVRMDILDWKEEVTCLTDLGDVQLGFTQLEKLHESLQLILNGKSRTREKVVGKAKANEKFESRIRKVAADDSHLIAREYKSKILKLYGAASLWKDKAEAIISTLRMHGNLSAGQKRSSLKLPAMVDIKRISDLLAEYGNLDVEVPGYMSILEKVFNDATTWSAQLNDGLLTDSISFHECLELLKEESEARPRGLIMDPTRQVIDTLMDLLEWYQKAQGVINDLKSTLDGLPDSIAQACSNFLTDSAYPILAEGMAVLEVFSRSRENKFVAQMGLCAVYLEQHHGIRRSSRALTREKIESHPLGLSLLQRMIRKDVDEKEGDPLAVFLWVSWHLSVSVFLRKCSTYDGEEKSTKRSASKYIPSLVEAQNLQGIQPILTAEGDKLDIFQKIQTVEVDKFFELIDAAKHAEDEIRELLSKYREMRKGSLLKAALVRQHLNSLKEYHLVIKERAFGGNGLSLSATLEPQLEHHIKIFSWLVRTFSYPFLYLDEASYSTPIRDDSSENSRIPWDALVSLNERLPSETEARADDFALVAMRVKELYEAAKQWQDEITRSTLLSNRGGRRRAPTCALPKSEQEEESSSKIQIETMKQLAENPILSKVAMPREGAVHGILRSSTEFETQLYNFLGRDFEGKNPDRAAFPGTESLVGKNGQFALFRLSGSELFETVLVSTNALSAVAENVLAETPGKAAFEWIKRAVEWIDQLNSAVTKAPSFQDTKRNTLVLPSGDARHLLKEAEEIFLVVPDDLKRTLSHHGIMISTNKQEKSLRVVPKKGGAHHSVGGTVIRWCPILFECLRNDVAKLELWERELTMILSQFNAFFAESRSNAKNNEKDLYRWYCFRERVATLLGEGARSLVVAPQQGLVSSFTNLLSSLQNYLSKNSRPELDKKFAREWFAESTSLLDDRYQLLECLLHRKNLETDEKLPRAVAHVNRSVRETCRSYLSTGFSKAVKTIGMAKMRDFCKISDLESLCSIKAWEIENELFDRFQDDNRGSCVSEEYKDKARSLRVSLHDKNNLALRLRVLIGEVSVKALVSMSKEQLASQKARMDRERAEKAARSSTNLTPKFQSQAESSAKSRENHSLKAARSPTNLTPKFQSQAESSAKTIENESLKGKPLLVGPTSILRNTLALTKSHDNEQTKPQSGAQTEDDVRSKSSSLAKKLPANLLDMSATDLKQLVDRATVKTSRPPPPPSLVHSFQATSPESPDSSDRGQRITNEGGGDRFRIDIVNLRLTFQAALYAENRSYMNSIPGFLPQFLVEKGRLPDKEFSRFLSEKAAGGRWVAIPLRLTTLSDQDAKEYKRFYQTYELKRRIAMFTVNQNTKVFLVTPKFHGAAKGTGVVSLAMKSSTYAIVLTKDTRVLMEY